MIILLLQPLRIDGIIRRKRPVSGVWPPHLSLEDRSQLVAVFMLQADELRRTHLPPDEGRLDHSSLLLLNATESVQFFQIGAVRGEIQAAIISANLIIFDRKRVTEIPDFLYCTLFVFFATPPSPRGQMKLSYPIGGMRS